METIEDLKAALAAKDEEVRLAKEAEAQAKTTNAATVDELKELRTKKQEAEAARDLALAKLNGEGGNGNVETEVKKVLDAEKAKEAETTRQTSLERFKNAHKELFAEANDAGGLKFKAFEASLSKLNLSGLQTTEQFTEAYENALILMSKGKTQSQPNRNGEGAHIPANGGGAPKADENNNLSYKEQKLIESLGWTEERYLKQKKARPTYVESMLSQFVI